MKWLPLPQRLWHFANIIGRAYNERQQCLYPNPSSDLGTYPVASGPPQLAVNYMDDMRWGKSLLELHSRRCIDVRKLDDWQKATDFETTVETALKNPEDNFWKDFDLNYSILQFMKPYESDPSLQYQLEVAKVINNIPVLARPYLYYRQLQIESEYTRHQLDGVDFDESTEPETDKEIYWMIGDLAYWKKNQYAIKYKNFRQIYVNKGELQLKGTFKEKQIHHFRKYIYYETGEDGVYTVEQSDIDEFEVEVNIPVDDPHGGELNIINDKVQAAIDEIYNLHDEKIDRAYITHSTVEEKSFFFTKDNFVIPELKYWDINAMPQNIKNKLSEEERN